MITLSYFLYMAIYVEVIPLSHVAYLERLQQMTSGEFQFFASNLLGPKFYPALTETLNCRSQTPVLEFCLASQLRRLLLGFVTFTLRKMGTSSSFSDCTAK